MTFKFYDMTYENQLAYSLFTTLKSRNIPLRIAFLIGLHSSLICLAILLYIYNDYDIPFLLLGLAYAFSFSWSMYKVFIKDPRTVIRHNAAIINQPREFIFDSEEFTVQRTDSNEQFSEHFTFKYPLIKAVRDTKDYIFIDIDGRLGSLFFAKSVLSKQQLLELTVFLHSKVGKRYLTYWKKPIT